MELDRVVAAAAARRLPELLLAPKLHVIFFLDFFSKPATQHHSAHGGAECLARMTLRKRAEVRPGPAAGHEQNDDFKVCST